MNPEDMIMGSNTFDGLAEQDVTNGPYFHFTNNTTPDEIQAAIDAYS